MVLIGGCYGVARCCYGIAMLLLRCYYGVARYVWVAMVLLGVTMVLLGGCYGVAMVVARWFQRYFSRCCHGLGMALQMCPVDVARWLLWCF